LRKKLFLEFLSFIFIFALALVATSGETQENREGFVKRSSRNRMDLLLNLIICVVNLVWVERFIDFLRIHILLQKK